MNILANNSQRENLKNTHKPHWQAFLLLDFVKGPFQTILSKNRHEGPLCVQRPFYPETGGRCHCYILHPPGGVVGGDCLNVEINAQEKTHVLLTTPGAGKFYRSPYARGHLNNRIVVGAKANVEWLPQETIFFNGADAQVKTIFELQAESKLCAWDITCLGRPAAQETFNIGNIAQRFEIWQNNKPLLLERYTLSGNWIGLHAAWGWRGFTVSGVFVANDISEEIFSKLMIVKPQLDDALFSLTKIGSLLIARYLGESAEQAKQTLTQIWHHVRVERDNSIPLVPRIWNT